MSKVESWKVGSIGLPHRIPFKMDFYDSTTHYREEFEIFVAKLDNPRAWSSFGWDDPNNKIIILDSDDFEKDVFTAKDYDKYMKRAMALCEVLNNEEEEV